VDRIRGRYGNRLRAIGDKAGTMSETPQTRFKTISYVRVPNSASVDRMLLENEALKKDLFNTLDDMSLRLTKTMSRRKEQLKKNKDDYDLEQRRRLYKQMKAVKIQDKLRRGINEMTQQIQEVYNVTQVLEWEN
jgi:hypothetical protein